MAVMLSTSPTRSRPGWPRCGEHRAYLDGLGPEAPDPAEMLEGMARQAGTQLGVPMAVSMEVFPLQLL